MLRVTTLMIVILLCMPAIAMAQTAGGNSDATGAAVSAADAAFESLAGDVKRLMQSLTNKGGIAEQDHELIRAMRERATSFSQQFPNDARGLKVELMLSKWLKDDARVAALFQNILRVEPDNADVSISWARLLRTENKYAEAIEVFNRYPPDPIKSPTDLGLWADCLFAEHRFEEALAVLELMPADPSIPDPMKQDSEQRKTSVREHISLWANEQMIREKEEIADDLPRVMMVTSRGPITIELFENQAPNTVANFISLIEQGFYNTTKFHRVIANFMAQGGDPNSKPGATGAPGMGDPGYFIPDETAREDHRMHFTGSLSMANTGAPNSGGCQFFLNVAPTPHLNGKHTVFGRVLDGIEIVRSIKQDDVIEVVTVLRKRDHAYTFDKVGSPTSAPVTPPPAIETPPTEIPETTEDAPPADTTEPSEIEPVPTPE